MRFRIHHGVEEPHGRMIDQFAAWQQAMAFDGCALERPVCQCICFSDMHHQWKESRKRFKNATSHPIRPRKVELG
jgi:hypothetical protein